MKKTLLLAFALILSVATFAQQQLATLNHKNEYDESIITVYYGLNALQQAHNAAVKGDIITLSPGTFNSVNITKAVTIRGAGMFPDVDAGTAATTLINNYTITIAQVPDTFLYMEGIYNACSNVYYAQAYIPQFAKCYFKKIQPSSANATMYDATFTNCIIESFSSRNNTTNCAKNPQFANSVILDLDHQYTNNIILTNCVAKFNKNQSYLNTIQVYNSILYDDEVYNSGVNAYSSYYSIGIQTSTYSYGDNYFNYSGVQDHHLYNYKGLSAVFGDNFNGSFNGNFIPGVTFELKDDLKTTRLGSDGKQIGIYGGITPFDPKVRNPLIGKVTVAPQSTSDGKLQVEIDINQPTNNTNTTTDPQ